jgi:hypothetical protein
MSEYPLQFATRQIRRAFERAIGRSIPKILTELITNADDSYRHLSQAGIPISDPAPITVLFERSKKRFAVVDRAEGLTDEEMKARFVVYGQESVDRSLGMRTRSLFGKGLRDVLFTQRYGQVKSIKEGKFFNCRFRWKPVEGQERPVVEIKPPSRVTNELREALGIPNNGTFVEFQLGEGVRNPQTDKLVEKLGRFYMLRMINSSPHREVSFTSGEHDEDSQNGTQLSYIFPELEELDRLDEELRTVDGAILRITGTIGLTQAEQSQGEVCYEDREGGLLVSDEDEAVLDLSLFGFDDDPSARRISGSIKLIGAGDYIRRKLNEAQPEEILTETRDGFDKNHLFYRALKGHIQPRVARIVESLREKRTPPKSALSEHTQEKHKQAFDLLNQLYKEMIGKTGPVPVIPVPLRVPPAPGIAFVNSHISIQSGVLTPVALLLNRALVQQDDDIDCRTDTPDIVVFPSSFRSGEAPKDLNRAQVKILRVRAETPDITGKLTATWKDAKAEISITATRREIITPINGIEFERDKYSIRLGSLRHLRLYVDIQKIPVGSEILLNAEGEAVKLVRARHRVEESNRLTALVAQLEIEVRGEAITENAMVTASVGQYIAGTKVSVSRKEKKEPLAGGIFQGYTFVPMERKLQALFDPQGWILINTRDPVNHRYFGVDPFRSVEEAAHCQVRLADLVLGECLQMMVSEALQSGKLDRKFPNNPEFDVQNYVAEKKFEIGPQIHALFVTKV